MKVEVVSYIPGKGEVAGEYHLESPSRIVSFLQSIGIAWNHEALVIVNQGIVKEDYQLQNGDVIYLLIPILGG